MMLMWEIFMFLCSHSLTHQFGTPVDVSQNYNFKLFSFHIHLQKTKFYKSAIIFLSLGQHDTKVTKFRKNESQTVPCKELDSCRQTDTSRIIYCVQGSLFLSKTCINNLWFYFWAQNNYKTESNFSVYSSVKYLQSFIFSLPKISIFLKVIGHFPYYFFIQSVCIVKSSIVSETSQPLLSVVSCQESLLE